MDNTMTAMGQTSKPKSRRKTLLRWGWDGTEGSFVQPEEERSDRVVGLIGGEVQEASGKMRNAFDLAWHRLCPNQGDENELSDRGRQSLEVRRDDAIEAEWGDDGNPGSVMLDRDKGFYCLMAWDLGRDPGMYLRWIRLDPAQSDTAIRRRVRRFLLKHGPLGNIESLFALHVEEMLEEWASEKKGPSRAAGRRHGIGKARPTDHGGRQPLAVQLPKRHPQRSPTDLMVAESKVHGYSGCT